MTGEPYGYLAIRHYVLVTYSRQTIGVLSFDLCLSLEASASRHIFAGCTTVPNSERIKPIDAAKHGRVVALEGPADPRGTRRLGVGLIFS